mmetsp:Transcript_4287/g.14912  ORF Transcript_4287/g.14912 Transcript_4287/m.14912 type:complete len:221 (+) Transcript_4287:156-818(+)
MGNFRPLFQALHRKKTVVDAARRHLRLCETPGNQQAKTVYTAAPAIAVVPYNSACECNTRTGWRRKTSRTTPPPVHVIADNATARRGPKFRTNAALAPMMQKPPKLNASNQFNAVSIAFDSRTSFDKTFGQKKNVKKEATKATIRYSGSAIQKTGCAPSMPINAPRMVPPPMAVTHPTTTHPSKSKPLFPAAITPPCANTPVPNKSTNLNHSAACSVDKD